MVIRVNRTLLFRLNPPQAESLSHQRKGISGSPKHPERAQPDNAVLFQPFRLMRETGDALNERALPFLGM